MSEETAFTPEGCMPVTLEASLCGGNSIVTEFRPFLVWSVVLDEHGNCMATSTLDPQLKHTHTHTVQV